MRKNTVKKSIRIVLIIATLVCCCFAFCACHVFAWYIPKSYSDAEMAEIYAYLKDELLTNLSHTIASISYEQDGCGNYYDIFCDENKTIITYDVFVEENTVKRGLYFDGVLKEWDVESRTETVSEKDIADYDFLFARLRTAADYFKTQVLDVMPHTDDSYCWECFPWGMGMAQMYYITDDGSTVSASWTVEKPSKRDKLPLIYSADFYCGTETDSVRIQSYGLPYGIDESIQNILENYEQSKQTDIKMLYKTVYIKGFDETLYLELYNNDAAKRLAEMLAESDITIELDNFGGFEKSGNLGFTLPVSDERITANCGDVMLYRGNCLALFYGENTADYTPIGYISGYSDTALNDIIGADKGKTQITLSLDNAR